MAFVGGYIQSQGKEHEQRRLPHLRIPNCLQHASDSASYTLHHCLWNLMCLVR